MDIREMVEARRIEANAALKLAESESSRVAERVALDESLRWLTLASDLLDSGTPSEYLLDVLAAGLYRHGADIDWAVERLNRG